jgi:hypothetical protein
MSRTRVRIILKLGTNVGKGTTELDFGDRLRDDVIGGFENDIEYRLVV